MIAMICLFFPAVLAMWLYESVEKEKLETRQWCYRYSANVLMINFICFAVKKWLLHTAGEALYHLNTDMIPSVAVNYLIMAVPVALFGAVLQIVLHRNVAITVEETAA